MGAVFRALDTQLDRHVAIKLLPPDYARDPETIQRFYQEGRAAARLDHENIARVFSIGQDNSLHYIAFEFIEGTTVRQKVERDGILSTGEAIEVTLQVAAALVHASARGVVHRDVKPSNIIITPEGRAKLVDMGLARRFERGEDTGLTQTGMYLGTFDYISPEQGRDPRDVDVRSDLYSLGCTLFFMLSGRPPFPDGNVVQKLMKHQEEPAPDIRLANPGVPAELAGIITKLMAKDRDRRYQTPEQLVRDLLSLSASLGLRSTISGIPTWSVTAPPAWERHLIWAVPALAFMVLIAALILAGPSPGSDPGVPPLSSSTNLDKPPRVKSGPNPAITSPKRETASDQPRTIVTPVLPREITVNASDDLFKVISEAPPRSTILLANDGPYTLRTSGRAEASRLIGLDLTIKADLGSRPVIRLARGPGSEDRASGSALFDLKGGRLVLDGLELLVDSGDRQQPSAAIQSEDTDLTIRRCLIRRSGIGVETTPGRSVALRVRSSTRSTADLSKTAAATLVAATLIDACHIDAGLTALATDGPVEVFLRDTTIGPASVGSSFELRNLESAEPASLSLRNVSLIAGSGPVFACAGVQPRIRVEASAFAPAGSGPATLVESDEPSKLDWRGTDNLFGRIGTFLQPKQPGLPGRLLITDFSLWADAPNASREFGSSSVSTHIWDEVDPARLLTADAHDPSRFFRLGYVRPNQIRVGARQGPFGVLMPSGKPRVDSPTPAPEVIVRNDRPPTNPSSAIGSLPFNMLGQFPDLSTRPMPKAETGPRPNTDRPPPTLPMPEMEPVVEEMPEMPVMPPVTPRADGSADSAAVAGVTKNARPDTTSTEVPKTPTPPATSSARLAVNPGNQDLVAVNPSEPRLVKTAEQFIELLRKASNRGESLKLAADADWEIPASALSGTGLWTIRAEPGATRPRLKFRPSADDLAALKGTNRAALLTVLSGSLRLEGVDIVVPFDAAPKTNGCAAIAVGAGGDVSLTDCTVTVEGNRPGHAVIRVLPSDPNLVEPDAEARSATIRLKNCLLRSGGDLIDIVAAQPADIELDNAGVATGGSLLHGHGGRKNVAAETIKLTLRQVSARVAGGVVQLESTAELPELPFTEVVVRNSVFATNAQGDPLIRLDGQEDADALRGRVHWDGHNVAYHRISTYRRDQVRKVGTSPTLFDRASWEVSVGKREASPIHDDLKFIHEWPEDRMPWTLVPEDLQLKADSPAALSGSGCDLSHIPSPTGA